MSDLRERWVPRLIGVDRAALAATFTTDGERNAWAAFAGHVLDGKRMTTLAGESGLSHTAIRQRILKAEHLLCQDGRREFWQASMPPTTSQGWHGRLWAVAEAAVRYVEEGVDPRGYYGALEQAVAALPAPLRDRLLRQRGNDE